MSTHTQLSFDGFGINDADDYRTRLATFAAHVPDARRKELGALWIAAPAMLEALKDCLHNAKMRRESGFECGPTIEREIERTELAIRLAEGRA